MSNKALDVSWLGMWATAFKSVLLHEALRLPYNVLKISGF